MSTEPIADPFANSEMLGQIFEYGKNLSVGALAEIGEVLTEHETEIMELGIKIGAGAAMGVLALRGHLGTVVQVAAGPLAETVFRGP